MATYPFNVFVYHQKLQNKFIHMCLKTIPILFVFLISLSGYAEIRISNQGQSIIPRIKPKQENPSLYLNDQDYFYLKTGLKYIEKYDWDKVLEIERKIKHPIAKKILLWSLLRNNTKLDFAYLSEKNQLLEAWPDQKTRQRRIETALITQPVNQDQMIQWFKTHPPLQLNAKLALAKAYLKQQQPNKATQIYLSVWHAFPMSVNEQKAFIKKHKPLLKQEDYVKRIQYLLWKNAYRYRSQIYHLMGYLNFSQKQYFRTCLEFTRNKKTAKIRYSTLSAQLKNNPELLFFYGKWLRKQKEFVKAAHILKGLTLKDLEFHHFQKQAQKAFFIERKLLTRSLIKEQEYELSYQVISHYDKTNASVLFRSEAEWLSGWLSLRFLNQPERAKLHFINFIEIVRLPISKSRGYYWLGRTYEALNNPVKRDHAYQQAAAYPTSFYGQIASEALNLKIKLDTSIPARLASSSEFYSLPLVKALLISTELETLPLTRKLFYTLAHQLTSDQDIRLLYELAQTHAWYDIAIRITKIARKKNDFYPSQSHPLIPYFNQKDLDKDASLLLSIARQESEFNPIIISHAGARGIMQLMPSTAKRTAQKYQIRYKRRWLTEDPYYNINLGFKHLQDLNFEFQTSYPLMIAAYNAGSRNVKKWLETFGNPGTNTYAIIDWIESIPFSETRNYVQRVMENMNVYEFRLYGKQTSKLTDDLKIYLK